MNDPRKLGIELACLESCIADLEGQLLRRPSPLADMTLQQALDTIDAQRLRTRERLQAEENRKQESRRSSERTGGRRQND